MSLTFVDLSHPQSNSALPESQREIIERLPSIFFGASENSIRHLRNELIDRYFTLSNQSRAFHYDNCLLCYSATIAIQVVATYLRRTDRSVALIEPTLGNIYDVLNQNGVQISEVIPEDRLVTCGADALSACQSKVIWIVLPNNPTGRTVSMDTCQRIAEFCARSSKLLVLDCSLRMFSPDLLLWDQYFMLKQSGASVIVIEDTGKLWPLLNFKVGVLICSDDLLSPLRSIQQVLISFVSPFQVKLISEFLELTLRNGLEQEVWANIMRNRRLVGNLLRSDLFEGIQPKDSRFCFEWLALGEGLSSSKLGKELKRRGTYVTRGRYFYWKHSELGERFIRLSINTTHEHFTAGLELINEVASSLSKDRPSTESDNL